MTQGTNTPLPSDGHPTDEDLKVYIAAMAPVRDAEFRKKLAEAINYCSRENGSDTPDFILGDFLANCLSAFDAASCARERWYSESRASLLAERDALVAALEFTLGQLDELINRFYGGELPCSDEEIAQFKNVRSALAKSREGE